MPLGSLRDEADLKRFLRDVLDRELASVKNALVIHHIGRGSPEGVVSAPPGHGYHNLDGGVGSSYWVKQVGSGNTGWATFATGGSESTAVANTPTLGLTLTGTTITGNVLDSPTVGGATPAQLRDRATHTGTQLHGTISDFDPSVIALLTDANIPNTITLDNLTQITTRNHSDLAGLTSGDPHTQYPLKSLLTTRGDLYTRDASTVVRLGIGTSATFLRSNGTDPSWQAIAESDVTNLVTDLSNKQPLDTDLTEIAGEANVRGDILYTDAGPNWKRLAKGAANTVLHSDGTDVAWASLTDADIPDTITLGNITQITTRSHASLQNLSADDHTQYFLLAGRSGGQIAQGDTAASGVLTLQSTANATRGTIDLRDKVRIWTEGSNYTGTGSNGLFRLETAFSVATTNAIIRFVDAVSTITYASNDTTNAMQLFRNAVTMVPSGTRSLGNIRSFVAFPTISPASGSTTTVTEAVGVHGGCSLTVIAGGGTGTISRITAAQLEGGTTCLVDTGWTATDVFAVRMAKPGGVGTITNLGGLLVEDISGRASTVTASVRSLGTTVPLRHAGPAAFGVDGVPNTTTDVNGDFATRAANLALANGANNNIAIGARSFIRITGPTAAFSITGIASGFDGKNLVIYNTTAQNMTISNNSASSTAANRILTGTGADVVTAGTGAISFIYDATQSLWICIGTVL